MVSSRNLCLLKFNEVAETGNLRICHLSRPQREMEKYIFKLKIITNYRGRNALHFDEERGFDFNANRTVMLVKVRWQIDDGSPFHDDS